MSDQATAVDPAASLFDAIGEEAPELENEDDPNAEETKAEDETKAEGEQAKYIVKVKTEAGIDEDREVTVDELAKGYMLQADYTRKTQEIASQRQNLEVEYGQALREQQTQAVDQLSRLQELVISQAAPELNGVDWVTLSVQDPARFVQLKARQDQVEQTWRALEQRKAQHSQANEQLLDKAVSQVLKQSDEVLSREIPGLDAAKTEKLLGDVEKSIGWKRSDLHAAAKALASAGMHPQTLGKVLVLAHKAMQFDELQKAKPAALKKVAEAPKVLKPGAAQPKQTNQEAVKRLQRSGRIEDLAALLG